MHRVLNLVLLTAIGVVSWRVYTTWSATEPLGSDPGRARTPPAVDLPSMARTPPKPLLASAISERDLFDESRRAPTAEVVADTPVPPPDVELVGVLIAGPEPEALIREAAQGNTLRHVFVGDEVGGYTVSAIAATEVILTSPDGSEVPLPLTLNRTTSPGAQGRNVTRTRPAGQAAGVERPTAAGLPGQGVRATTPQNVRERLRELRRKRREANKPQR